MKNWKRLLALCLSGAMALSLSACSGGDSSESASPSPAPSSEASGQPDPSASPAIEADLNQGVLEFSAGVSPTDTLLTINGTEVHADLFLYMLAMNCMNIQQYLPFIGQTMEQVGPTMLEETVSMAVQQVLMRQKAAELGCLLTDEQNEELRKAMDEADLDTNAPFWGLTEEGVEFIFEMNAYHENIYNAVTHDPSGEELAGYLYRVKHILFKTVDDSRQPLPDDQIAQKRAQAEEVLAQLQKADDLPALFDQLMNEHSEDGRSDDGALAAPDGYLAAPGDMVAEFETASKALKEGELSGLVESDYGYHIILRLPLNLTDEEKANPEYAEGFRDAAMAEQIGQWAEASEVTRADALSGLNVADFYAKLAAYQQALLDKNAAESAPIESGGVG